MPPAPTPTPAINNLCRLIIVIASLERLAFKGITSTMVTYLIEVMKMSNLSAAKYFNMWIGFTSMMPLLLSFITYLCRNRYYVIVVSAVFYAGGFLALTIRSITCPATKLPSLSSLSWCLYMISVAQGSYNPSLQAFGVDNLDPDELKIDGNDKNSDRKRHFFQWSYFGVCSGIFLGILTVSYVQEHFGWELGFAIPVLTMTVSIIMFVCGTRALNEKQKKKDDVKSRKEIVVAIKERLLNAFNVGCPKVPNADILQGKAFHNVGIDQTLERQEESSLSFSQIVMAMLRLLPAWLSLLMFAVVLQQPATFFTKQAMTMNRTIFHGHIKIPAAALQCAIPVTIIIVMLIYNKLLVPLFRNRNGVSVKLRMAIGMAFSIVAMLVAALVEKRRLKLIRGSTEEPMNIIWLLPPYILLGISDFFTVVEMQHFFCSQVPVRMRTIGIAMSMSVYGVGSFLGAFVIKIIDQRTSSGEHPGGWFSDDMAEARLDNYYLFLAAASAISLVAFIGSSMFLQSKK